MYALGPIVAVTGIIGFGWLIWEIRKSKNSQEQKNQRKILAIFLLTFLIFFILSGLLFAKWTRFAAPAFPLMAVFSGFFLGKLILTEKHLISRMLIGTMLILNILWTVMFFSIYRRSDVRITATNWINKNFPVSARILVEGGNMLDVPLSGKGFARTSLDFYNLETDEISREKVINAMVNADYFIVQSRRVFMNHKPDRYPRTADFYQKLFSGKLGFKEENKFESFPQLKIFNYVLTIPDERAEETWSVFDHPVIRILKKKNNLTAAQYKRLLGWQ